MYYCWLDSDPGHDDAFAILLASHSQNIKLLGISTTNGNQTIEKTTNNALKALNIFGKITNPTVDSNQIDFKNSWLNLNDSLSHGGLACPVIKGMSKPLLRPGKICDEIHGDSGLDAHVTLDFPTLPECAQKYVENINSQHEAQHFTTQIFNCLKNAPQKITLIATGPLTNVALLLINYPEVYEYIENIYLMGGAMGVGNTGPVAEFNIQVDPEAASYVFESGLPIYMVPLEITHQALVTREIIEKIRALNSNLSVILCELLLFFKSTYKTVFFMDEPPLHDPVAVAAVVDPSLFEFKLMRVDIETGSLLSYGQTVCDIYGMSNKKKNVYVCMSMNVEKFWSLMFDVIKKADLISPCNKR